MKMNERVEIIRFIKEKLAQMGYLKDANEKPREIYISIEEDENICININRELH